MNPVIAVVFLYQPKVFDNGRIDTTYFKTYCTTLVCFENELVRLGRQVLNKMNSTSFLNWESRLIYAYGEELDYVLPKYTDRSGETESPEEYISFLKDLVGLASPYKTTGYVVL